MVEKFMKKNHKSNLKLYFNIVFLFLGLYGTVNAQQSQGLPGGMQLKTYRSYELSAEANAFMCPFLSPKYMQRIHSIDSCNVWRTDDLVIHVEFTVPITNMKEQLLVAAEKTGYERKNIIVREIIK